MPDNSVVYLRSILRNGLEGPALIVSKDTTIIIDYKDIITIDEYQNLLIDIYQTDQPQ
jgi:hypothetical protein